MGKFSGIRNAITAAISQGETAAKGAHGMPMRSATGGPRIPWRDESKRVQRNISPGQGPTPGQMLGAGALGTGIAAGGLAAAPKRKRSPYRPATTYNGG